MLDYNSAVRKKATTEERRSYNPNLPQRPARLKVIKKDKEGRSVFEHLVHWANNKAIASGVEADIVGTGYSPLAEFYTQAKVNGINRNTEKHDRNLETQSSVFAFNDILTKRIGYGRFEYLIRWPVYNHPDTPVKNVYLASFFTMKPLVRTKAAKMKTRTGGISRSFHPYHEIQRVDELASVLPMNIVTHTKIPECIPVGIILCRPEYDYSVRNNKYSDRNKLFRFA